MFLWCLYRPRAVSHAHPSPSTTGSYQLSVLSPSRSRRRSSARQFLSRLRENTRRRVDQLNSSGSIKTPKPAYGHHRRTYKPPSSTSSYASTVPLVRSVRPAERPPDTQTPPPRTRKPVPGNFKNVSGPRTARSHAPSPTRPPHQEHPAFRKQTSKSDLPQISISSPSNATTRAGTPLGATDLTRLAASSRPAGYTIQETVPEYSGGEYINPAYAAHIAKNRIRNQSIATALISSDDGTTEAGDTSYVGPRTPYIGAATTPDLGVGRSPLVRAARSPPPVEAFEESPVLGTAKAVYVERVGRLPNVDTQRDTLDFGASSTTSTGASPHFERVRRDVVNERFAKKLQRHGVNVHDSENSHDDDNTADAAGVPYRPYITGRGGARARDREREHEARIRLLLESDSGATTTFTTDAGGGDGASAGYSNAYNASSAAAAAPYIGIRNANAFPPPPVGAGARGWGAATHYPAYDGIRSAGGAEARGGKVDLRGYGGVMFEVLREAERRLEVAEREAGRWEEVGESEIEVPLPLMVRKVRSE